VTTISALTLNRQGLKRSTGAAKPDSGFKLTRCTNQAASENNDNNKKRLLGFAFAQQENAKVSG
jgi:hypothetical protein